MEPPPPAYTGETSKAPPYGASQQGSNPPQAASMDAQKGVQHATYVGNQAPPPANAGQQGTHNKKVYWAYWSVLFASIITWIFSVTAAAHDALIAEVAAGYEDIECTADVKLCELFNGAKAFQYMATVVISVIIVLVVVAAFMPAPKTGKLGLATGISLAVFSVFQLIAFSLHAAYVAEYENYYTSYYSYDDYYGGSYYYVTYDVTAGENLAVAIIAWIFGLLGCIVTLVLFRRATTDQDGPFNRMVGSCCGENTPKAPAATPVASYPTATATANV